MLDTFCSSLKDAALQHHLLVMRPETMAAFVQHGYEFLQIKPERAITDLTDIRFMEDEKANKAVKQD